MPRLVRLPSIPFGWYYVVLHGVADRKIINRHSDLMTVLKLLRSTLREQGARLHAGYIAEREVHLALQVGERPLSAITGRFQHEYARLFNRTYHEHGSLFRLHHHVLLFQQELWLVELVHFIHWIRRLESPDHDPDDLWWSSDAVYRGLTKLDWLTTNVVLRMLTHGTYDRQVQEQAYRRVFERVPGPSYADLFMHGSAEDPRILGSLQFIKDVWRRSGRRLPNRTPNERNFEDDIPDVVMRVIERFNALCDERLPQRQARAWRRLVTYDNVRSRSRRRPLPMVRALTVSYLIEHEVAKLMDAACFFGCGPSSVSARRRRFYETIFRECFGVMPAILFSARRGEPNEERRNEDREKDLDRAGYSELAEPCGIP